MKQEKLSPKEKDIIKKDKNRTSKPDDMGRSNSDGWDTVFTPKMNSQKDLEVHMRANKDRPKLIRPTFESITKLVDAILTEKT